jgi:hypothetical protein
MRSINKVFLQEMKVIFTGLLGSPRPMRGVDSFSAVEQQK